MPEFSLPPMVLRTELKLDSPAHAETSVFPEHFAETNSPTRDVSASTGEVEGLQSFNVHSDRFYLEKLDLPAQSSFGKAMDALGQPEVVHVGKKVVTCSAITAVKRKNPLCLLNANILKVTW